MLVDWIRAWRDNRHADRLWSTVLAWTGGPRSAWEFARSADVPAPCAARLLAAWAKVDCVQLTWEGDTSIEQTWGGATSQTRRALYRAVVKT